MSSAGGNDPCTGMARGDYHQDRAVFWSSREDRFRGRTRPTEWERLGLFEVTPPIPSTVWCSGQRTRVVLCRAILLGELILNVEGCRNIGLLKVRVTALHACAGTERRCRYRQSIRNAALEGSAWSAPLFRHFTPGKDGYCLYRRLGGPRGRSGRVLKISPPDRSARSCWRPLKIIFFFSNGSTAP